MLDFIKLQLKKFNIDLVSAISLSDCEIKKDYLLKNGGIVSGSVFIFAIPYYTEKCDGKHNISAYAVGEDYHIFVKNMCENIILNLKEVYPNNKFLAFADHSPINEISASAKAGLGIIGKNNLLITEKYSSYVFIGEIISDYIGNYKAGEIKYCENCGKCEKACPKNKYNSECLSSITQKKGEFNENEIDIIVSNDTVWGCDICQEVCPHTIKAKKDKTIYSKIDFFNQNTISYLTSDIIEKMSDEEFGKKAFSWRGKSTILRNIKIKESECIKNG